MLAAELSNLVSGLSFKRSMRWQHAASFSRPVRWLVALHGNTEVPFSYAGVVAGRSSRLLRQSSTPEASISSAADYRYHSAAGSNTSGLKALLLFMQRLLDGKRHPLNGHPELHTVTSTPFLNASSTIHCQPSPAFSTVCRA